MCGTLNKINHDELMTEYNNIEIELDTYCTSDENLEQLTQIRNLLDRKEPVIIKSDRYFNR